MNIEKIYPLFTDSEVLRKKDWAAGSKDIMEFEEFVILKNEDDGQYHGELAQVQYPPALYKCYDEIIVNALDHYIRQLQTKQKVSWIKVSLDRATGRFSVSNSGPGVHVEWHPSANMWVPQLIFGERDRGSNMEKDVESITGGVNGLGAKVANAFSTEFTVETVRRELNPDGTVRYHKFYFQRWRDHMEQVGDPIIADLWPKKPRKFTAAMAAEHTTVTFVPDYTGIFGYERWSEEVYESLVGLLRFRVWMASAYASQCLVHFNDEVVPVKSLQNVVQTIFPAKKTLHCVINAKGDGTFANGYPWDVYVTLAQNNSKSLKELQQLSNVNGVVVKRGKHINWLLEQIIEHVRADVIKLFSNDKIKFSPHYVYQNIFIAVNAKIPGVSWSSQGKNELFLTKQRLAKYTFDKKFLNGLSAELSEQIKASVYKNTAPAAPRKNKVRHDKYDPAERAGTKDSAKCSLLLPEGDSACAMCNRGFGKGMLSREYYGLLTLGGVIMNARKKSKAINIGEDFVVTPGKQLSGNKFWNALITVCGLNIHYSYDPGSETYAAEMRRLRYGRLVVCVDQDHDGIGFIFPLLLNLFARFWPNLLRNGYIQRFATPIKRAKPKSGGQGFEFYTELEYRQWLVNHSPSRYSIDYYKGLGSHEPDEVRHMFRNFSTNIYTYYVDDLSDRLFEVMFGDDAEPRKEELRRPIAQLSEQRIKEQLETRRVSCSDVLTTDAKEHAFANNVQTLWSYIDGMNESGRKILHGSIGYFSSRTEKIKVAQLSAYIAQNENYHHGEQNLDDNIKRKAFLDVGGVQLPQLIPLGEFGSRLKGGAGPHGDAASSRYVYTKLNKKLVDLLYPPADQYILEYTFDEGKRGEPKYFVPIVPMAILESVGMPGTGWAIEVWARDAREVIRTVRRLIYAAGNCPITYIKPFSRGFTGKFQSVRGQPYSFGKYWYEPAKNIVHVTELPLRVWTRPYMDMVARRKTLVDDVVLASEDSMHLKIQLKPGAYEKIINEHGDEPWADGIEEYLELRDRMNSQLNFIDVDDTVVEFPTYASVIKQWFPIRMNYYELRIKRELIILDLKIQYYENMIRFVNVYKQLGLIDVEPEVGDKILEENNFQRFNKEMVINPKYTPIDDIVREATASNVSYDYLLLLNTKDKYSDANRKRQQKLEALREEKTRIEERAAMGKFTGAQFWLDELEQLEQVINEGESTNWLFGEKNKYWYGANKPAAKPRAKKVRAR